MAESKRRTPLAWAAERGHFGVVQLLLAREDINPNIPDGIGRTPLALAVRAGHDGVVKLLKRQNIHTAY